MIIFQKNINYMLREPSSWTLSPGITINFSYDCEFYSIDKDTRVITAKTYCGWDGATKFPDFNWILEGSLFHDIMHWLIAKGVIPESDNDLIDEELALIIKTLGGPAIRGPVGGFLLSFRSNYVKAATHLASEKLGAKIPIYKLEHGKIEVIE